MERNKIYEEEECRARTQNSCNWAYKLDMNIIGDNENIKILQNIKYKLLTQEVHNINNETIFLVLN